MTYDVYSLDYIYLIYFYFFTFCLLSVLLILSFLLSKKVDNLEKKTPYECGFEPFESSTTFNINFYVLGLSFLVFDLELVYLYPWALYCGILDNNSFFIFLFFIFNITIGLLYEIKRGLLIIS
jgi:NADH-quinone oxidoreductase subunit A